MEINKYKVKYYHVNEFHINGNDTWTNAFNSCSDWFLRSIDQSLTEEEREEAKEIWFQKRQCMELGIY